MVGTVGETAALVTSCELTLAPVLLLLPAGVAATAGPSPPPRWLSPDEGVWLHVTGD